MKSSKGKKKALVPRLRFPEFVGDADWSEKSIGDACDLTLRKTKKPDTPYLGLGVRNHGKGTFLKPSEDPCKNAMEYLYEVHEDDLVLSITFAWEGSVAIAYSEDQGALVSHRFPTYVFNRDVSIPDFFKLIILDKMFVYHLGVISPGGAGRNRVLSKNDFVKIQVKLPSIPEQQKIADCLSSLDDLITAETEQHAALQDHKKGLMQQLFPAESKTTPKHRFPEFEGEWEVENFSKLYEFKSNNSLSRDQLNYEIGLVKNIHYGDIHTKLSSLFHAINERLPFINDPEISEKIKKESYCLPRDIIFADASEDMSDIGKNIEIINTNEEKIVAGLHTILARPIENELMLGFAGHLFKSARVRQEIKKEAQGAKVLGLSKGRLMKINLVFPSNDQEQQKIADCLTSLDNLISAQSEKIEDLKVHKKGLLQQLFPSADIA